MRSDEDQVADNGESQIDCRCAIVAKGEAIEWVTCAGYAYVTLSYAAAKFKQVSLALIKQPGAIGA